jgi:hypothetical protein
MVADWISRLPCAEVLDVHGVSDRGERSPAMAVVRPSSCCLPPVRMASALPRIGAFAAQYPARPCPCQRFTMALRRPAHDSGSAWFATPSPYGSFIRSSAPAWAGAPSPPAPLPLCGRGEIGLRTVPRCVPGCPDTPRGGRVRPAGMWGHVTGRPPPPPLTWVGRPRRRRSANPHVGDPSAPAFAGGPRRGDTRPGVDSPEPEACTRGPVPPPAGCRHVPGRPPVPPIGGG